MELRQQLDQLHTLDNRSEGTGVLAERPQGGVGAAWRDSFLLERLFPAVESVQVTELLSELLVRILMDGVSGNCEIPHPHAPALIFSC